MSTPFIHIPGRCRWRMVLLETRPVRAAATGPNILGRDVIRPCTAKAISECVVRALITIIAQRCGLGKVWSWARFSKEVQDCRLPAARPASHFLSKTCPISYLPTAARMTYVLGTAMHPSQCTWCLMSLREARAMMELPSTAPITQPANPSRAWVWMLARAGLLIVIGNR